MSFQIPFRDKKLLETKSNMSEAAKEAYSSGINYQTQNYEKTVHLNIPPAATDARVFKDSSIIMGDDRYAQNGPGGNGEGGGASGMTGCSSIGLRCGHMATQINKSGVIPAEKQNPSLVHDAVTLYMSAKTTIEKLYPDDAAGSGLYINADKVLFSSRMGTQIVTDGDVNASGKHVPTVAPIIFRPGNAPDSMVQPLVKGDSLVKALENIINRITQLAAAVNIIHDAQQEFNAVILEHTHYAPIQIALGSLAGGGPFSFFEGKTFISPEVAKGGIANLASGIKSKKDLMIAAGGREGAKVQYLNEASRDSILSRWVRGA